MFEVSGLRFEVGHCDSARGGEAGGLKLFDKDIN